MFMDVARDPARWFFWAALGFERAYIAIDLAGAIQKRLALMHGATCPKLLPARAVVNVAGRIIAKVAAREGAVIPLRLVKHGNMGRYAFLLDQPVQHRSCPVGGIPDKPLRLEAEALLSSLDHGLCGADLGLPNGAGGLDVNDDAELHVDEIVVGVREECRSFVSSGPLRRGIGWGDELRHNVAGGSPRGIVKGRQILLHRAAGPRRITIPPPILTRDRALLVGVGLDQARIDLDLHLIIETEDGHRIALSGDGQAAPRPGEPVLDIFANVRLSTASKDYAWVNERQIWGVGTASLATGKVRAEGFMQ
jgi:hypothetical protein